MFMQGYIEKEGELKMMDIFLLIFSSFHPVNEEIQHKIQSIYDLF